MLQITLHTKLVETQDGKKFTSSRAEIKGKWFNIKFRQGCKMPNDRGLYHLTVLKKDVNVQKGGIKTKEDGTQFLENDTLWVADVVSLTKFTDEEMNALNEDKLNKALGM